MGIYTHTPKKYVTVSKLRFLAAATLDRFLLMRVGVRVGRGVVERPGS